MILSRQSPRGTYVSIAANGFDAKHILVDGKEYQICLNSSESSQFPFRDSDWGLILSIQIKSMGTALCAEITEFEDLLKRDAGARERFIESTSACFARKRIHAMRVSKHLVSPNGRATRFATTKRT